MHTVIHILLFGLNSWPGPFMFQVDHLWQHKWSGWGHLCCYTWSDQTIYVPGPIISLHTIIDHISSGRQWRKWQTVSFHSVCISFICFVYMSCIVHVVSYYLALSMPNATVSGFEKTQLPHTQQQDTLFTIKQ